MHETPPPAFWTPVVLNLAGAAPSLDWGDLRGVRFAEPFFQQTVERWAGGAPAPLIRTGLGALATFDAAPSLDPDLLVFHASRCGSTLLSRLLGTVPGVLVVAEPPPLNALLLAAPAEGDDPEAVRMVRRLVRALGQRRFGDERHFVLKLSSWNVRRIELFRRAFPAAAVIWLQRDPTAIAMSLLADPPGWLARGRPDWAPSVFGRETGADGDAAFCVRALAAMLAAATEIAGRTLFLDYAELPAAVWQRVAPFLGIALTEADVACMRREAGFYAKDPGRRPFTGDDPARPMLSSGLRALLAEQAEPLYRGLDRRRQGLAPPDLPISNGGSRCFRDDGALG
ncbi:MAG TPA: sulfotransferase [Stellaceae bacterium]|nr:sulfotransferase [Stellaceae bacterium]